MITEEDLFVKYYGFDPKSRQFNKSFKPDFSEWIAFEYEDGGYCISPKEFWLEFKYKPDFPLPFRVPGIPEAQEHVLELDPSEENKLLDLGFTILYNCDPNLSFEEQLPKSKDLPKSIRKILSEQAFTISKKGKVITISFDDSEDANDFMKGFEKLYEE